MHPLIGQERKALYMRGEGGREGERREKGEREISDCVNEIP
jgi:hypothetical protein